MLDYDVFIDAETMVVDIHKFTVLEAKYYLERLLASVDQSVYTEILVIHGYQSGERLKRMVKFDLKSNKIKRKICSWNNGRTSLILR